MYLAAMGIGLGSLVRGGPGTNGLTYLQFVAPGLLAATAMQIGSGEATFPVMASFKWVRNYHAMAATPLTPADILVGHVLWMATRVAMACGIYLGVVAGFGAVRTPLAVLALPASVVLGLAFSLPITASRESDNGFAALQRFIIVPMFLFSGTFFNVMQLPAAIRWIAYATPLWHGVQLDRDLTTGRMESGGGWVVAAHVVYLTAMIVVGAGWSLRLYRRRLAV
jgi:lipooligosaccharide transport system permease protein